MFEFVHMVRNGTTYFVSYCVNDIDDGIGYDVSMPAFVSTENVLLLIVRQSCNVWIVAKVNSTTVIVHPRTRSTFIN